MKSINLHEHGYRLTPQRYLILQVLEQAQGHLSAAQILELVQQHNPQITLPTIYRTLDLLKELGLVLQNHLHGDQATYEALQGRAHHHLFCQKCQSVRHLDSTLLGTLYEQIEEQFQFHGVVLILAAVGYCEHCWQELTASKEPITPEVQ